MPSVAHAEVSISKQGFEMETAIFAYLSGCQLPNTGGSAVMTTFSVLLQKGTLHQSSPPPGFMLTASSGSMFHAHGPPSTAVSKCVSDISDDVEGQQEVLKMLVWQVVSGKLTDILYCLAQSV